MALLEFSAATTRTRRVRTDASELELVRFRDVIDDITRWDAKREARFSYDIANREVAVRDYVHPDNDVKLLGRR